MMVQRIDDSQPIDRDATPDAADPDDRLGEAIEEYLALAERDQAPDLEEFLARYEDMKDDLRAAMEGLELVHGLVGRGGSASSGSGRGAGPGRWLESGHRIAGYRIVRELGRGGMGTVYEAVHVGLDRPVALKVLGTHAAPDSSARRRFLNEAKTAAGLHHTHIVPVFDVGQVGGLCYYAMQRIEGSGLDRVIRHLRRSRAGGLGPAGSASSQAGGAADAGSSSFSSRLGQIWFRVSPGWLWRQPRHVPEVRRGTGAAPGAARDRSDASSAQLRSGLEGIGVPHAMPITDSTASWASQRLDRDRGGDPSGSTMGLAGPAALHATEAAGRGDEPPPFDPPRGSAYFRWVAALGLQSADALAHAHHQGVIHRDVKPSNLLIDAKGNIWVTDFGLARRLADPGLTHHDSLLGTPRYMSPEQARTTGNIDGRTDVYSLGATLYEFLTLRPPFDGQSAAELVDQIGRDDPVAPRKVEPRVPRDLETIVLKALAKRPADRYATAAELAEDLARFLSYAPVKARRISPVGRLWRVARRHPQIAAVTTTAAAVVLAIATYAYVRILAERAEVITALEAEKKARDSLEQANRESQAARRDQYLKMAQMLGSFELPDRRGQGLDLLHKAVELGIPRAERPAFRDEAVKFLVLRDVVTHPPLTTGRGSGLSFGPQGHRLWVLSDEDEALTLWDLEQAHALTTLPLREGSTGGDRPEPGASAGTPPMRPAGAEGRARARAATAPSGPRHIPGRSLALAGNYIAAILPDGSGVQLIDALAGTPLRRLSSPGHAIVGVIADPTGQRLVTIDRTLEDFVPPEVAALEGGDDAAPASEYKVNLWDLDGLEWIKTLDPWRFPKPPPQTRPPQVAISPDGKIIAVAPSNATWVRLFLARDGGLKGPWDRVDTQTKVSAVALGPNALMAAAVGDQVRLYDMDNNRAMFVTSFQTRVPSFTWLMRFSPAGTLALAGWGGRIELWDPAAQSRIAVLTGSDQSSDLAFSPDGRMLAAIGWTGVTSTWSIQDAATRTQLSGFEARPTSLAFGDNGTLAGGGMDGGVWAWRGGKCPESGMPRSLTPKRAEPTERRSDGHGGGGRGPRSWPGARNPDRPTAVAFDAEERLVVHEVAGVRIWPAGPISDQPAPSLHELPDMKGSLFNMPRIARTPDGRIMAMLRSQSIYLWRSDAPDRLIPVIPPPRWTDRPSTVSPTPLRAAGVTARTEGPGNDAPLDRFRAIQIAPGGSRLYLIDMPGRLHIWDIAGAADDAELHASEPSPGLRLLEGISSVALRRDGAVLAVSDPRVGAVTLLDTARRTVLGSIKLPADEPGSVFLALAFSPDGSTLAVGSQQGTISLYGVDPPAHPGLGLRLPGHRGLVTNLVFDASGNRLASAAGTDPLVEVWDLGLIRDELLQRHLAEDSP